MIKSISTIGFKDLKIHCIIGVFSHERSQEQLLKIDLEMDACFDLCIVSDDCKDTIDYAEVAHFIEGLAKEKKCHLLETLSHECLEGLFSKYCLSWAKICIKKPAAMPNAGYAFVTLEKGIKRQCER